MSPANARFWMNKGLKFICTKCGLCCKGPKQAVWVNEIEVRKLAQFHELDVTSWVRKFTQSVTPNCGKWLLRKSDDGISCVFLTKQNRCSVHPVRPIQCSTYPFWPEHLISSFDWKAEGLEVCEGIHHESGRQISEDEVLTEMLKTELNRESPDFDMDVFEAYLHQSGREFIFEFAKAFWNANRREVRFDTDRFCIIDTTLLGTESKRSLIFKSSPSFVQSEVQLKKTNDSTELVPDHGVLLQRPYQIMLLGLITVKLDALRKCEVGIIGAGCGALPMYLHQFSNSFPNELHIEAVDVDLEVLEVGKTWFNFATDENLTLKCMDGLHYLNSVPNQSFDFLVLDVAETKKNTETKLTAPPKNFYSTEAAQLYWSKLTTTGLLVINTIGGYQKLKIIHGSLGPKFSSIFAINVPNGSIYFAWKTPLDQPFPHSLKSSTIRPPILDPFLDGVIREVDLYHEKFNAHKFGWLSREELA